MEGGYVVVLTFFSPTIRPVRKIKHNGFFKPTPHSPYIRLAVSPEMVLAWFIGKKSNTAVDNKGRDPAGQVPPS